MIFGDIDNFIKDSNNNIKFYLEHLIYDDSIIKR